jgi:DNA-binding NarL/FixJ family response regulator
VIVDDDERFVQLAENAFALAGNVICVGCVGNSHDALRILPMLKPDVALVSITLGDMAGMDCARSLKALLPALRIIILAASSEAHLVLESLMGGAGGYLIKPVDVAELARAVRAVQRGGVPLCPFSARVLARVFQTLPQEVLPLTNRQRQVAACVISGQSDKEIADCLGIGSGTVHTHLHHMFRTMGVHCRVDAIQRILHVE